MCRWRAATMAVLMALSAMAEPAFANDSKVVEARRAYDRGAAAYNTRDWATAAVQFARADELAPNEVVLQSAIFAADNANDPIFAMTLVDRGRSRGWSLSAVDRIVARLTDRVASLKLMCAEGVV